MRKRLYKVEQGVWGAYETVTLYFETKAEAEKYVEDHDYCEYGGYVCQNETARKRFIEDTIYRICA